MTTPVPYTLSLVNRCKELSLPVQPLEFKTSVDELLKYITDLSDTYNKQIDTLEESNTLQEKLIKLYETQK